MEDTFCSLSSGYLELIPLVCHCCTMFLPCVRISCPEVGNKSYAAAVVLRTGSHRRGQACVFLELTAVRYRFLGTPFCWSLPWHLSNTNISPISAAILLFSLKTLRSLSDGILGLDKVLIKSKLDWINQIKCEGSVSPWCCMFLVVSVESFHWICLEIGCLGFEKVGAHLFMFWSPCVRINLF